MLSRLSSLRARIIVLFGALVVGLGIGLFLFVMNQGGGVEGLADVEGSGVAKGVELGRRVIGRSVEGREVEVYGYGSGAGRILFVGGIHGGYEWNSVALAYQAMDYLEGNPSAIPSGVSVAVIPSLNPDGVYKVVGKEGRLTAWDGSQGVATEPGRFNARGVDLNRNFDCKWQPESAWRGEVVSAGSAAFSEPEARALRDFVLEYKPEAVVFWHSQATAVYASECEEGILPETLDIMNAYARAAGYAAVDSFDAYSITGDAEGWLASIGIPAITVELSTHEDVEWSKNLAGMKALFSYYGKQEVGSERGTGPR